MFKTTFLCTFLCPLLLLLNTYAWGQNAYQSPARADVDPAVAPFYHGVASGDPLPDRVILWTRITTVAQTATVRWQVATDTVFNNIVLTGTAQTDSSKDYTVKVDAAGLQPNTWYYYRFRADSVYSLPGRTRTAPIGPIPNLRFAVVSCSDYQSGFFNAYRDIARKNDVDAVIHLGDYIYEYGISDFAPGTDTSRMHAPEHEALTLAEYRVRHSQYKLDADLRELHRQVPFIAIWDDHETANDSWTGGAGNHTPATEGPWDARKNAGRKAYFEWMPIRDVHQSIDTIHRVLDWGSLAQFIMLDTRLEGREQQMGVSGAAVTDTNRTLMGRGQLNWFKNRLSSSAAQWKLVGNQVMMSPLRVLGNAVNQDQWDGYPAERTKVLRHIQQNDIDNVVVLTGDIHTSWANDVPLSLQAYNSTTGAGSTVVEMVCTSITRSGEAVAQVPVALLYASNPNVKYAEVTKHGYILLDLTPQRAQGDWVHMSTITATQFTTSVGASWQADSGANHLTRAAAALAPRTGRPPQAPKPFLVGVKGRASSILALHCSPNPANNKLTLQYHLNTAGPVHAAFYDSKGRLVQKHKLPARGAGLHEAVLPMGGLTRGVYSLRLTCGKDVVQRRVVME